MHSRYLLLLIFLQSFALSAIKPADKPYSVHTIAFYNVENLFDTEDDPITNDNQFTPGGKYQWDGTRYLRKQKQIAEVISKTGDDDGPEFIGLAEAENARVLNDLINQPAIKRFSYKFLHFDSPDERGIDVALLYKSSVFVPLQAQAIYPSKSKRVSMNTRDILLVKGLFKKDTLIFLINHWPSRRAGKEQTADKRMTVAMKVREICDSLFKKSPKANIIVMGDFNDEPQDASLSTMLLGKSNEQIKYDELYNGYFKAKEKGEGTIKHNKDWLLIDQILISKNFLSKYYVKNSCTVFHPLWLHYKGHISNGPYRTFNNGKYQPDGYSDHFPVYLHIRVN
ncbi:MAG: hypothetical protein ACK40G_03645 [Cytophagaceae bacterium]